MSIEFLVMGMIENNVYVIDDGNTTFVVDPSCDAQRILKALDGRNCEAVVLTHAHWDHVGAAAELREATGARVIASAIDASIIAGDRTLGPAHTHVEPCPVDEAVSEGDMVSIGSMQWQVMVTPGHTPGSICLYLDPRYGNNPDAAPVLISGDTLFAGAHGRTDFEGGSPADMRESLKRLSKLPESTIVLPGHNAQTTIARERGWLARGGLGI